MARKFVSVSNGRVSSGYFSSDGAPPTGGNWLEVSLAVDLSTVVGRSYNPATQAFGDVTPPPRLITRGEFMDRFPIEVQLAMEAIAEQQSQAGRLVRVFTRRLEAEPMVDLTSPALEAGLLQLRPVLTGAGVPGWEDEAAASASIAALLA